jgi:hypothetical protein
MGLDSGSSPWLLLRLTICDIFLLEILDLAYLNFRMTLKNLKGREEVWQYLEDCENIYSHHAS